MTNSPVEEGIVLILRRLSLDEDVKQSVESTAFKLASEYLERLSEEDERCALDVALSAVYNSCVLSGLKMSQTQIALSVMNGLNRWPVVAADMGRRLNLHIP